MRANDRAIVIMAKQPDPGRTKTRLQSVLSPESAAELYRCFLLDTARLAAAVPDVDVILAVDPPSGVEHVAALFPDLPVIAQHGADLGERLDHVLASTLERGYHHAAAIGSDSPTLPATCIEAAFAALDRPGTDVVLGPADDGGYYLIAVEQPPGPLVREVVMSTPTVLEDTLSVANRLGLSVALGRRWYDVDEAADLARLRAELSVAGPEIAPETGRFLADADLVFPDATSSPLG